MLLRQNGYIFNMKKSKQNSKKKKQEILAKAYFDPANPGSYGGKTRLVRSLNTKTLSESDVAEWLRSIDSYTLYRPTRKRFLSRKTIVSGIDACWQLDLTVLDEQTTKENDGLKYILFCIDVFSRYAWAKLIRNKTGSVIVHKLDEIFTSEKRTPFAIQTDKGKEFVNTTVSNYLQQRNIKHYTSENNDIKASLVERLQRTIKERLYRYFTHMNSQRFVDVLDQFMFSYNNSFHSSIKRTPSSINHSNYEDVWNLLYIPSNPFAVKNQAKLEIGDEVRISKVRGTFEKAYTGNWSEEIYHVSHVLKTDPSTYKLKDDDGDEIAGTWYKAELQKVTNNNNIFRIEAVVGKRKLGEKHNCW